MQKKITLKISPEHVSDKPYTLEAIARETGFSLQAISGYYILKKSLDARGRKKFFLVTLLAFINEPFLPVSINRFEHKNVSKAEKRVVIIGAGPAGLFAALSLIKHGIQPVIIERGKDVRERRRDLAVLNKTGTINPDSNYCFGEGGAGTYSDGKLYTRSNKRGSIEKILHYFVHFGANENILFDAHPHIGTNKLPAIITAIRHAIIDCGGEFHFNKRVEDLVVRNDSIKAVKTADGDVIKGEEYILATGHSARDIYLLLHRHQIAIEPKPFALGVRVEHPQELINHIQYGNHYIQSRIPTNETNLPPASYSLVSQVDGRGVFSFCMCPGGIIATASTSEKEMVVNGWSPSKRNNPFANSGMVVQLEIEDIYHLNKRNRVNSPQEYPFIMLDFQRSIEQRAYTLGGGQFIAPAQRLVDFVEGHVSVDLPQCSYVRGLHSAGLVDVFPTFIYSKLRNAFTTFEKKMPGYYTNEAVVVAAESRTSSPIRVPRDRENFHHPQIANLFPCGEGAGYAGGIVSAAIDGERVAHAISLRQTVRPKNL